MYDYVCDVCIWYMCMMYVYENVYVYVYLYVYVKYMCRGTQIVCEIFMPPFVY
jgi:hypothetical protein